MESLLSVSDLRATYITAEACQEIVKDVSFSLMPGNVLALVGESGSGKTTLSRALTRLVLTTLHLEIQGIVQFGSIDLLRCDDGTLRKIRQTQIRYIFQEPQQALNPVLPIRKQMEFASGEEPLAKTELISLLSSVGLSDASGVLNSYPHQLSIGMAQRVMIAMAILPKPLLLIADEPTSAMDASLRYQLLDLLKSLQVQNNMAMILITHDLLVAQRYANEIAVMQNGRIVELASTKDFFVNPQHPYSRILLDAIPHVNKREELTNDGMTRKDK